jgi:hypothetical protein
MTAQQIIEMFKANGLTPSHVGITTDADGKIIEVFVTMEDQDYKMQFVPNTWIPERN